jgi:hypothetical protein
MLEGQMTFTRADLLAAVERSPAAAAAHDRAGWLGLFTPGAVIEDPVGSRAHRGRRDIGRFYDAFIGPRDIAMDAGVDIVDGRSVLRDLDLHITMAPAVVVDVPAYLRYHLVDIAGVPRIEALQAYWELPAMMATFARLGPRILPAGLGMAGGLLRHLGPAGAAGFLGGIGAPGPAGKAPAAAFFTDLCAGDEVSLRRALARGAALTASDGEPMTAADLLDRVAGARVDKVIAAGPSVVAGAYRAGCRSVLVADVATKPFRLTALRCYTERD